MKAMLEPASRGLGGRRTDAVRRTRRILVPTDFSPLAQGAVDAALQLLEKVPDSRLTLVHVVEPMHLIGTAEFGLPPDCTLASRVNDADARMQDFHAQHQPLEHRLETRVLTGAPGRILCDLAAREGFDLMVLSSHGHTGLARMLIGSVAEQVVQDSPCSVLVVKHGHEKDGRITAFPVLLALKNILVGYHHTPRARRALDMAMAMAKLTPGHLTLLHVLESATPLCGPGASRTVDEEAACEVVMRRELAAVRDRYLPDSESWTLLTGIGHPWEVIVAAATESHADLVIVGTHECTRWGHGFAGSTAQMVVRLSPCPVLVVK